MSYYINLLRKHYPRADAIYIDICGQDGFEPCGVIYGRKLYAI